MAIDVKLPEIGDGITSADVLEVLVAEGDSVTKDQGLLELETDKATVTVPSPLSGKVVKILVAEGQSIPIGGVIMHIEGAAVTKSTTQAPSATSEPPKPVAPTPIATETKPALALSKEPQPVLPPAAVAASQSTLQAASPRATNPVASPPTMPVPESEGTIPAGPAIRRFAREVGIDLTIVRGTGEGGRITREDVLLAVRDASAHRPVPTPTHTASSTTLATAPATTVGGNKSLALPGTPAQDAYGQVRVERMSKIRKTISTQMHKSWSTVPHVTNFDDADVTDLEAFRASSKDDYAAQGIKLTTMPFLIKAVATSLKHHPTINAVLDLESDQILYKDYVNVGIAIDTDRGLVVPNLRNADRMSIPEIAKSLGELAGRVRSGEFGVNELRGGTFTISNLGAIGGTYSSPIINIPEVAILLVGRTRKLPVVMDDDSIKPRLMMPLSLSYDHRLVDGGTAARFLNDVIAYLEAPSRLLLAIA